MSEDAEAPDGDLAATAAELVPILLDDLRSRARWERRRVGAGETLRTTALVNEAFLRLQRGGSWNDERHFLHAAALAMRQVLVDHARARRRIKRGSGAGSVELADWHASVPAPAVDVLDLDAALKELEAIDAERARIVELRHFAGLSIEETARALGISDSSVKRGWLAAKTWIRQRLDGGAAGRDA